MEFREAKGIYFQISEYFIDRILSGVWKDDEKLPSIREMAVEMEVNPNTAARAYAFLQEKEIIQNRRGIGYFLSPGGADNARKWKKEDFVKFQLPSVFRSMQLIGLDAGEFENLYNDFCRGAEDEKKQ
jgi:GntR family transcriptional regulator